MPGRRFQPLTYRLIQPGAVPQVGAVKMVRRKYKKKRYKKRRRTGCRRNFGLSIARTVKGVMPRALKTKLKYNMVSSFSGVGLNQVWTHMRLNSLYDPVVATGGQQPRGFDQMAAFFGRYRVDRVDCIVNVILGSSSLPGLPMSVILNASNSTGATPGRVDMLEATMQIGEQKLVHPALLGTASTSQGFSNAKFKFTVYPHLVTGVSVCKYKSAAQYSAQVTTDPTEHCQLIVSIADVNNNAQTFSGIVTFDFVYHAEFFDKKAIAAS